jgi:ribosomal protein S18 acetylase RimI-like enzyme
VIRNKIKFADAAIDNRDQVCKIYQEFIVITHASQPENIGINFQRFLKNKDGKITLVFYEEKLAGFVEYRPLPLKLRDKKQKVEITSLYVRPLFQKNGLGKSLIENVVEYAKSTNRDRVVLYSGLELIEAHKFYERVGFRKKAFFYELKVKK